MQVIQVKRKARRRKVKAMDTIDTTNTTVDAKGIRTLAIEVLDSEDGISEKSYSVLRNLLLKTGNKDIVKLVDATDGRFYLGEDDAEDLRKV